MLVWGEIRMPPVLLCVISSVCLFCIQSSAFICVSWGSGTSSRWPESWGSWSRPGCRRSRRSPPGGPPCGSCSFDPCRWRLRSSHTELAGERSGVVHTSLISHSTQLRLWFIQTGDRFNWITKRMGQPSSCTKTMTELHLNHHWTTIFFKKMII